MRDKNIEGRENGVPMNKIETAKFLRISVPTLERHMVSGLLPFAKVGGRVLFREESLERVLKTCEQKTTASVTRGRKP